MRKGRGKIGECTKLRDTLGRLVWADGGPLGFDGGVAALLFFQDGRALGSGGVGRVEAQQELPHLAPHLRLAAAVEHARPHRLLVRYAPCARCLQMSVHP